MIITELILIRYKRFSLNSIDYFKITFNEIIQLILGTNGCGKSSLLKELTPLPASPDDFHKDGSKSISLTNRGSTYLLSTIFSPKVEHSFIKNDEELNPGKTVTVFRELVRQEFGITNEIHELITGYEQFTEMSPSRKREWFTRLSDTSYDYALSVFNKLKERSRDTTGALKLAKRHLVTESAKVITEAEETKMRKDVDLTLKELNILIEQSAPLDRPINTYLNEQEVKLKELSNLSSKLLRLKCVAPYGTHPYGVSPNSKVFNDEWGEKLYEGFVSKEEVDVVINKISHDITAKEVMLENAIKEHSKVADTVKLLIVRGKEGVDSLIKKKNGLRESRDSLLNKVVLKIEGFDPEQAVGALDTIYDTIETISLTIPENPDKKFSSVRLKELEEKLIDKKNLALLIDSEMSKLSSRVIHLESHKTNNSTICPNCNHKWIPGYSDECLASLINELKVKEIERSVLSEEISIIEHEIEANHEYGVIFRDYVRCVRNWPALNTFWDYVSENRLLSDYPRKLTSVLSTFKSDLSYLVSVVKIEKEIVDLDKLIWTTEELGDANLEVSEHELETLTNTVDRITAELAGLHNSSTTYSQYRKQLIESSVLSNEINKLMSDLERVTGDAVEMIRRDTLNHCVKQLQSSLALKETVLNAAILQKNIIADLEKQITRLIVEEEASKLLVSNLSPTEGLIAEGLFGFVKHFTKQMNMLIKKSWSYDLHICECYNSNGELDYKFPLRSRDNPVPDIKLGSTGMKEVINLSFKITAMKYLGLSESPLYLDEYGASMDEVHRVNASQIIKTLMETQHFTQLFMVSHYQSSHGGFINAETCVLDASNISVPDNYNKHVIIC